MKTVKSYSLKPNKLVYLLIPVLLIVTVPFIIMRIINIANMSGTSEGYTMTIDIVIIVLLAVILALGLTCLFIAMYTVKEHALIMRLGIFCSSIPLNTIDTVTYFRNKNKLCVYYMKGADRHQIVVNIDPEQFDDFVSHLKKLNPKIEYDVDSNT